MKFLHILAIAILMMASGFNSVWAEDNTSAQGKTMRSELFSFIKVEGFTPSINDSGTITFKYQGQSYYIHFYGSNPVAVDFYISGFDTEDTDMNACHLACNSVMAKKYYVKCYVMKDESIKITIEMPCANVEDLKAVFYENVKFLADARSSFLESYKSFRKE